MNGAQLYSYHIEKTCLLPGGHKLVSSLSVFKQPCGKVVTRL